MKAELIDVMGDDLRVANAARVSFDKESEWDVVYIPNCNDPGGDYDAEIQLSERDQGLIKFLAREGHWTPFSHVMITMRETVPIFVARQRFKHMVGFSYNEVSRRYVSDEPAFYKPEYFRKAAANKKQGSSDEPVESGQWVFTYNLAQTYAELAYKEMIEAGVAPEQARMVLPQSMYTSYYVTGSLAAWARAYKLRIDSHAQKEIQDLAKQWDEIIGKIEQLKYSWNALTSD